jgi:hypothetical protein
MTAVVRVAALACLLGSLPLSMRPPLHGKPERRPSRLRALLRRYDRSARGRQLSARLWRAQIDMDPSSWRCAQALVALPAATLLIAIGAPLPAGIGIGITVGRVGGSLLLWMRRGAAARVLDEAAPMLARALSVELSDSGSGAQAVVRAARRCDGDHTSARSRMVRRVLSRAADTVALGADGAGALRRAVDDAVPRLALDCPAAVVIAVFGLHALDSVATAAALEKLAASLEDDALMRREARAAVGDAATSAIAVPVIAAATAGILLASNPAALAAALSMPLIAVLGAAVLMVALAAAGTRRLVAL